MSRWMCRASLATACLAAACASTPEDGIEEGRAVAPVQDAAETTRTASAADKRAATTDEPDAEAEVTPDLVVDARDRAPGSAVRCRDRLKPSSNVIVTYCMTLDDWETFERREAQEAQEMLRALRGESY